MYFILFSRVKGHKGSPVLPRLLAGIVRGSLPRRAYFESLRAAEAKNAATINQLKYRSSSCIIENILGAWSRALGCASCFIGSRPRPRAIFPVMHSLTLTCTQSNNYNAHLQTIHASKKSYYLHILVPQSNPKHQQRHTSV